ncbi:MAG: hypothetical protein ABI183_18095 [Polyangiaceae bacterium]
MAKLTPCRGCKRHCRVSEKACPFCGARRLAIGASVVVFATLGVGWGDASADVSRDAGTNANAATTDAGPDDDGAAAEELRREELLEQRQVVPLYGTPPSPRQGCWR